jgi:hypothetical protein
MRLWRTSGKAGKIPLSHQENDLREIAGKDGFEDSPFVLTNPEF